MKMPDKYDALDGKVQQFKIPALSEGEFYVGCVIDGDSGKREHLVLLPGEKKGVDWFAATEWAKSIGGELPSLRDQPILSSNCQSEFKKTWYWTSDQRADDADYACVQYFDPDDREFSAKSSVRDARAVRRVLVVD